MYIVHTSTATGTAVPINLYYVGSYLLGIKIDAVGAESSCLLLEICKTATDLLRSDFPGDQWCYLRHPRYDPVEQEHFTTGPDRL